MTYYHLTSTGRLVLTDLPFTETFSNIYNHFLVINSRKPMLAFENLYRELMRLKLTDKVNVRVFSDMVVLKTCNDTVKVPYEIALEVLRIQPDNTTLDDLLFELENA